MLDKTNLVAVYGSLRKGLSNHRVLGDSVLVGLDLAYGWDMWSMGGFPAITENKDSEGGIVIEVYDVQEERIAKALDGLEGYPSFYNRMTIETKYGDAWVYFLEEQPSNIKVKGGDWFKYITERRAMGW